VKIESILRYKAIPELCAVGFGNFVALSSHNYPLIQMNGFIVEANTVRYGAELVTTDAVVAGIAPVYSMADDSGHITMAPESCSGVYSRAWMDGFLCANMEMARFRMNGTLCLQFKVAFTAHGNDAKNICDSIKCLYYYMNWETSVQPKHMRAGSYIIKSDVVRVVFDKTVHGTLMKKVILPNLVDYYYLRTSEKFAKKVPTSVLNGFQQARRDFLAGYNESRPQNNLHADMFKTTCYVARGEVLAQGMCILLRNINRGVNIDCWFAGSVHDTVYILRIMPAATMSDTEVLGTTIFAKCKHEGYVYEVMTESRYICVGVGNLLVPCSCKKNVK
jgi:hypothetical protein